MITDSNGFLSIEQLDRVNLKTMNNGGLPEPYGEGDIYGALKAVAIWHQEEGPVELTSAEATQIAVDWYCTSTQESVIGTFERLADNPVYEGVKALVKCMHENPALAAKAIDMANNGWEPTTEDD